MGVLLAVELAQGVLGFVQYFTDLPVPLVALHLVGRVPGDRSRRCTPCSLCATAGRSAPASARRARSVRRCWSGEARAPAGGAALAGCADPHPRRRHAAGAQPVGGPRRARRGDRPQPGTPARRPRAARTPTAGTPWTTPATGRGRARASSRAPSSTPEPAGARARHRGHRRGVRADVRDVPLEQAAGTPAASRRTGRSPAARRARHRHVHRRRAAAGRARASPPGWSTSGPHAAAHRPTRPAAATTPRRSRCSTRWR
jgi:hypothetical protein